MLLRLLPGLWVATNQLAHLIKWKYVYTEGKSPMKNSLKMLIHVPRHAHLRFLLDQDTLAQICAFYVKKC